MNQLQSMMEANTHLDKQHEVIEHIESVSKFWSVLNDEDKDYIHAARYAIEYQTKWEINE